MIAFIDLETTGLDPAKHEVLEVACIVTDDKLVEVARHEQVIVPRVYFYQLDEFIRDMHTKNGLWEATQADGYWNDGTPTGPVTIEQADFALQAFIHKHAVKVGEKDGKKTISRPQLAGNTISFDRAFMKAHLPHSEAELHYRNIDVSSLNELARRFAPALHERRPRSGPEAAHRAMADALNSLMVCRHYADALGQIPAELPGNSER